MQYPPALHLTLLAGCYLSLAPPAARGQAPLIWDHNADGTASDGSGTWLNTNQWLDGAVPATWNNGTPDSAIIGSGGSGGTITVGSVTAGFVLIDNFSGTYSFDGTNGSSTLTQSGGITIGAGAGTVRFRNTVIAGAGGITMNSPGLLVLGANPVVAHTYTGPTVINAGVVMLEDNLKSTGNFALNNGMLTDYYRSTTTFTGGLGAGTNQIQIYGDSGFGGGNGNSNWRIGAQNSVLVWGASGEGGATGFFNPSTLKFRAPIGDNNGPSTYGQATLQNRLDLNGAARTVSVHLGTGANADSNSYSTIDAGIQDTGATGSLTKAGGGALILGGTTSTWGGNTTVSEGRLDFAGTNIANIGGGSGRNISVADGASVRFNNLSNTILNRIVETNAEIGVMTGTTANNFDFSSSAGANLPNAFLGNWAGNGAKAEISGTITPGSNGYLLGAKGSSGLLGIRSTLSGANGLTVGMTGATGIRVNLVAANSFTGDTVINAGSKLTLGNNLALQNSVLDVGSTGGNFALAAGTNGGRITGETEASSPTFGGLKGSRNLLSVFTTSGGNNESNLAASAVTGFTLNTGVGVNVTYSGGIANFAANTTLTKTGAGTQILSGANTYTGATTISAGTLALSGNGSINNSPSLAIAAGATFNVSARTGGSYTYGGTVTGNGTINGQLTIGSGGRVAPGNSLGLLTVTGGPLTLGPGSTLEIELANPLAQGITPSGNLLLPDGSVNPAALTGGTPVGPPGLVNDRVVGDVTFASGSTLQVIPLPGPLNTANLQKGLAWKIIDGTVTGDFSLAPGDFTLNGGSWATTQGGIDLDLPDLWGGNTTWGYYNWDLSLLQSNGILVLVPEPSRPLLLAAALAPLILRRRKHHSV